MSFLRLTLLVCLVVLAVVTSAVVGVVVESDWCDDVQAVHVPVAISKGSPITTGNGTAWTDAGASVCTPVTSIDSVWRSYFTFNPDGPGTVKVQWDDRFFFEFVVDLPRNVCNGSFSSPDKRAVGGCYPCQLYTSRFECYFYWLGH
ncbi:uncharacterized protein ACA1_258000 [Acanthamoeba castellanii str. Neff]|uniref:Uncharacterized protein n=1 Tax=Acanthamoeba castellanii (strain ATCC 30010 / Neff) TaxID=1257118 RepID=L8GFD7_ACACF|nr:uncharacterized protein ACA1_258000 [Acanthamoeba castellanii str. Neff]ELR11569.1 hypothetical protein ACA1_258000 [Acanthamoeba castellanii str. Neff]